MNVYDLYLIQRILDSTRPTQVRIRVFIRLE